MKAEDYLAEMHGQIGALTRVCLALLAAHPRSPELIDLVRKQAAYIPNESGPQQAHYNAGMQRTIQYLESELAKLHVALHASQGTDQSKH